MSTVSTIATELLRGTVICKFAYPESFRLLEQNDELSKKVSMALELLNRDLKRTESGNAFFASHLQLDDSIKAEATQLFKQIINDIRPTLQWMELLAEASGSDIYVNAGDHIEYHQVLNGVTFSQSLQALLKNLLKDKSSANLATLVEKLFKKLKADGLLIEIDRFKKQYQFTGRLELLQSALAFIVEHNGLYKDNRKDHSEMRQGSLV